MDWTTRLDTPWTCAAVREQRDGRTLISITSATNRIVLSCPHISGQVVLEAMWLGNGESERLLGPEEMKKSYWGTRSLMKESGVSVICPWIPRGVKNQVLAASDKYVVVLIR